MVHDIQTQSLAAPASPIVLRKVSYEEFESHDGMHAEWVDGEVIYFHPKSRSHQQLLGFLSALITLFIEAHQLGELFFAPFQMKTGANLPGREPDILFIATEHLDRLHNTFLEGPADLAVEIVSADSVTRDRGDKFLEYEKGGASEYWLIDPERKLAEFYQLEGGVYRLAHIGDDGIYRSSILPGLWLRVDWLWQEPLPPVMSVLQEWGLVSK